MSKTSAIGGGALALLLVLAVPAHAGVQPTANDDTASTPQNTAININVLANDTIPFPFVLASPAVVMETDPSHGTATVNPDGKIHYVPNSGFTGSDELEYLLCTITEQKTEVAQSCPNSQLAVVDITVTGVPATTTSTVAPTTSVAAAAVTTTVAPTTTVKAAAAAAPNELPRTGSGSAPLGIIGGIAVAAGAAATLARRRNRSRA